LKKIDVLILGDFPPATHTGISMVNALVRDILNEQGRAVHIIDESAWVYKGIKRALHYLLGSHFSLLKFLLSYRTKYVYLNIPLSAAGQVRLFLTCLWVKLFSPHSAIIGHIHRGDIFYWAAKSLFNRFIFRLNLSFFRQVVVLSKKFEADLSSIFPKTNTVVIPNTSLLEGMGTRETFIYKNRFICISNFIRTKGVGDLIDAFADERLRQYHLKVFGNVYDLGFYEELKKTKTSNVELIPNPDRKSLLKWLSDTDCLILPSWNEGQPLVILEAMSLGVPAIATNVGDIPNMLGANYPFLFVPQNREMLKKKIIHFSEYNDKQGLSKELLSRYSSNYSRKLFENNIKQLFR